MSIDSATKLSALMSVEWPHVARPFAGRPKNLKNFALAKGKVVLI